ncbi:MULTISPECIES: hypothetical protein [Mycobacterium]|uniref:hypothetical protein n=1 Tax=Mycobacterium TaxID=1763 RepID=UPI001E4E1916|nr:MULTISPECIES: hypothetical protein [Mycobacterium]
MSSGTGCTTSLLSGSGGAHGALARVVGRGRGGLTVQEPLSPAGGLVQALGSRPPDGPRELGKRVSQLDTGGGRYLLGDGHGTVARDGDPFDREFGVEQPRCELLCADPRPQRGGMGLVLDLALHQQSGLVEPGNPGPHAAAPPLIEPTRSHGVGGGVHHDRHPRSQRANRGAQHTFWAVGQHMGAHHKRAQGAHQHGADHPGQLGHPGPQIQAEEVGHECDHAQRPSTRPEAADIDRGEHDHHERHLGGDQVRREQRGHADRQRRGYRQQRHGDLLLSGVGIIDGTGRDHGDDDTDQSDGQRLPGRHRQQVQHQQRTAQRRGGPSGHP